MDPELVDCRTCKLIHAQMEKLCEQRHGLIDTRLGKLASIVEQMPRADDLREVLTQRSTDRAWSLVGKIVLAAASIWLAFEKMGLLFTNNPTPGG